MAYRFIDVHTHSEYSACGEDVTVAGYAEIARTNDSIFALTDHSAHQYFPPEKKWGFWSDEADEMFEACREDGPRRIREYLEYVRSLQCGGMLIGVELDIMPDGRIVYPEELLGDLDVVLGVVHSMPTIRHERPASEVEDEFRFQIRRIGEIGVDALAHPFRQLLGSGFEVGEDLIRWTVQVMADAGVALEINSHKVFPEHDLAMVRMALEAGAQLAIGTDAHRANEFGDFSYHIDILGQAGVDEDAWPEVIWTPELPVALAAAGE